MGTRIARYLKILFKAITIFIAILFVIILLLRFPLVQTKLAQFAVDFLSKTTNTEIQIEKIALNFIDNISAKGIFLADENGDTLLYAEKLNVDIGILKLLKNTVDIDFIELSNSKINVYQKEDSSFSYQFLIDVFSSDTTSSKSTSWKIKIDKIKILNADYNFNLLQAKNNLKLKELIVKNDDIDLEKMFFSISKIEINQLLLSSIWEENTNTDLNERDSITPNKNITFPLNDLPIKLVCKRLLINKSQVLYQKGSPSKSNFFNPDDVSVKNINIHFKDVEINKKIAKLNVRDIQATLNNQFEIKKAKAKLLFASNEIYFEKIYLKTGKSELKINGKTSYKKLEDLLNFKNGTPIDLNLNTLDLAISEAIYFVPFLDTISYLNEIKNKNLKLSAFAKGTIDNLNIKSINAELDETVLNINGSVQNLMNVESLVLKNFKVKANTNIEQLKAILGKDIILPKYNYFGQVNLIAAFNGTLNHLNIQNLNLETNSLLSLSINGQVESISEIDKLRYKLNIKHLKTGIADAEILMDSLPEMLQNFEYLNYVGTISGGLKNYKVNGNLFSPLGIVTSDLEMAFNEDFTNATYEGNLKLDTFNLGKLLAKDSLGHVSFNAEVKGKGINLEDLDANINAIITQITYNNYNYKDIEIDGEMLKKQFIGKLNINDENLKFNFDGKINLNDTVPDLDFNAQLKHINTLVLNLTTFPLIANLNINAKLKGLNVNDIVGNIKIEDINLKSEKKSWSTDSITFKAEKNSTYENLYELQSTFLNAELKGMYDLLKLPKIFIATIDKYLAISPILQEDTTTIIPFALSNENIHLDVSISKLEDVVSFFNIGIKKLDTAFLHLSYDAPNSVFEFEFFVPALQYNSIYADSIYWKANGKNNVLYSNIKLDSISFSESIYIPGFQTTAKFENQEGVIKSFINDAEGKYNLSISTNLKSKNQQLIIDVQSPLNLNGKEWDVQNNEVAYIGRNNYYIPKFTLHNRTENLVFNYSGESKFINFTNFNLNNFTDLIQIDSTEITGLINGLISLESREDHLNAKGNLTIDNIKINDLRIGDLTFDVTQYKDIIQANLDLRDGGNYLNLKASYNADLNKTDANLKLHKFNLSTIAPLVQDYAQNLNGYLNGNVKILNEQENFDLDGVLNFNNVEAFIVPVGTNYKIINGTLKIDNNSLIPNINITDEINRNAYLNGVIKHNNFKNFKFDLNFNTSAFTFLNSKKKEEDFIFGKLVAKVDAKITGTLDLPKIKGDITTIDQSDLSIQLLSEKSVATQENYVIFLNGANFNEAEIDSIANEKYKLNSSIDLDLTVNINEKATLRVVIDPITGDNLVVNGNGTLAVKLPPYGDIDITGVYEVNSGLYSFSFQQLLKKKFEIVKGSQLKFAGNPMNATLNIQAAYNTDASTYELIENETVATSSSEQQSLKRKTDVSVLLNINGKLSEPLLSFDIKIPDNSSGPVGSSVTRALNKIKQNESELNKQVFSLLLFNSFTGTSNAGNISSSGTSTAVKSVGNLINSQLNKLAGKAEGLEINFNLDQYQDQFSKSGGQITDVELGISQSLFDDKIVISVGGNVGLESGQAEQGALSNVAGDFVLSYKITEDGKYNVKVFQKSDFDALNDANIWKTGVGFTYQTKFGRLRKINKR